MAKFKCDACGYEAKYERGQPWAPFAYERKDNGEIELPCPQCWMDYVRNNVPQMKEQKSEDRSGHFMPMPFALVQKDGQPLELYMAGYPSLMLDIQKGKNAVIDLRPHGIPILIDLRMADNFDGAKQMVVSAAQQSAEGKQDDKQEAGDDLARMVPAGSRKGH